MTENKTELKDSDKIPENIHKKQRAGRVKAIKLEVAERKKRQTHNAKVKKAVVVKVGVNRHQSPRPNRRKKRAEVKGGTQ